VALFVAAAAGLAAEAKLQEGDFVAVIGDSITEQRQYSVFIEDYLLMCQPAQKLRVTQFGWGGETADGFRRRMANDCLPFKPTVATTCYGMNDGGYRPFDPNGQGKWYRENQKAIVESFKKAGLRLIVVGSPGVVDSDTFHHKPEDATMYNETLSKLRDIAREVAESQGVVFANVFDAMMAAMTKAKTKYGKAYHVAGGDGVHPDRNGQLVMAYAFLKALGCDGNIGTITVDLADGKATATDGHKVLSCQGGTVELESSRYPFCFFGDPKATGSTSGMIEFFPFNEELNRFTLVVKGAKADRLKVTWGKASKEFDAAALEKGINLAAEFLNNPFCEPFQAVEKAIRAQQDFETPAIKDVINKIPTFKNLVPEEAEAFERVRAAILKRDSALHDAAAAAVVPVRHTLKVEPAQ
jgi:lysophospholipase L1-like esterase